MPYQSARLIELWCAEPVFFASRELSDTYYTEGTIGNYALAYALGWARSPYRLLGQATGRPTYVEDLTPFSGQRYILPAWPRAGAASFRFERFNALSDSYWYAMTNNRVATAREDLPLKRTGKKPNTFRPSNFPQTGRLRVIERGNRFQTLVFGEVELPEYIRVGKFMSKVRVDILQQVSVTALSPGEHDCRTYLNSADLPADLALLSFDLISIPPASLLKNLRFQGSAWKVGDYTVPANLEFCGGRNHD
ncbi:MAG: type I-D CRISPR-associated protein Cas5/Csc1 [Leptolyngbyaceae cyanobacterium SM1_1_3]|nr:type I-D CRISPR-associated protein Cas5/Csc1 [Leptolyngbyaceae cyanobacterium SM1_1_3]NJM85429.1 type I-D CRISPR-associated protein Cas5/Csc1 [Leptolyngbyaceae cyanobacterium RM2_2_21]NJN02602.1 type I-D CRISPR-associated protein Cas5/Csc1 [Leptolyngbyaceae cyanobacterium RM1_1_2]NJO10830.1 type I-D CRISPR-associated protein Cas5/Csc1 [Leptolyngbyaceae cyanobacterium SL_1_1]